MMTALIVDDEKKSRDSLEKLLKKNCPYIQVLDKASSAADAFQLIRKYHPQLVFLDIEMPDQNGFDLIGQLKKVDFKIIFVTAYSHYAVKAVDYLLKPVDANSLVQAVEKAFSEHGLNNQTRYKGLPDNIDTEAYHKLAVPVKDGIAFIAPGEIIRLEADGTYTHIFSNGEKFTATKNIKEYEEILVAQHFFRSHKSHLINLKHVKRFSRVDGYFVQMSDGSRAEVSRRKQEEFIEVMSRH